MNAPQPNPLTPITPPASPSSGFAWKILVVAVLLVSGVFYFWSGHSSGPQAPAGRAALPFGPVEQAYAAKISVENIALSRAENFLHQEVTTLSGQLINNGDRTLSGIDLTIEFFDELHQVVLRESRQVLNGPSPLLAPANRQSFEISVEHIPSSWNMQQPSVRVRGLQFAPAKE